MSKKKCTDGKCSICGQFGKLTYEHIPPKVTFNNKPVKSYSGLDLLTNINGDPWDVQGIKYVNNQKGYGKCCLCQSCNNITGSWYVPEYQRFVLSLEYYKSQFVTTGTDRVHVSMLGVKTLPIMKQIMSMYCSVVGTETDDNLRDFLLAKSNKGIDCNKYKICIYYNKGPLTRVVPFTVKCYTNNETSLLVELGYIPIGFIVYLNPKVNQTFMGSDITYFGDYDFDQEINVEFDLYLYECHLAIPEDFRTKQEIKISSK